MVIISRSLARSETRRLAKTRRKRHTYAVRVYFDAFVDFFAAHPALATRAFGAFANAAAIRLDQWRLLAASSSSHDADISRGGGRPAKTNGGRPPKPSKKANAANAVSSETRFVREGFGVVPFARAWSEDARAAVARVARLVEARPGKTVFPAGACASEFGVLLAGSTSEDVDEDAPPPKTSSEKTASLFPGSVVGAGAC